MGFNKPNYTQVPNELLGDIVKGGGIDPGLMAQLNGGTLKVILAITRITIGYHQESRRLSLSKMMKLTGLSRQGVLDAAGKAEELDLIQRHQDSGVTEWSLVVKKVDQVVKLFDQGSQKSRPPSKKETKKETFEKKVPNISDFDNEANTDKLFSELVELLNMPVELSTPKMKRQFEDFIYDLQELGAEPGDITAFKVWWYEMDWRGKREQKPTLQQVRETWQDFIDHCQNATDPNIVASY